MLGLTAQAGAIMRTVDKLEKIGPEKTAGILTGELGMAEKDAQELLTLLQAKDPMAALAPYQGQNPLLDQGMEELAAVTRYMEDFGVPASHFMIDLTIARGLDYYTGTVYETVMLDHPEIGSICSGGRYDNLAEYYTDKQLPGVGISIGLTRLFYVLEEQGMLNDQPAPAPADALLIPMTADLGPAAALATQLRGQGLRVQLYTEQKKFKAKMAYADKIGVPYVLFLGEDEIAAGAVSIKDMQSGQQKTLPLDQAAAFVRQGLAAQADGKPIKESCSSESSNRS